MASLRILLSILLLFGIFVLSFSFSLSDLNFSGTWSSSEHSHRSSPPLSPRGERTVLVISLSGFSPDYLDQFPLMNLWNLVSTASRPQSFWPHYPGTATPNLFSMATGLYPESHGALADTVYDPVLGTILTDQHPYFFRQNNATLPIWALNERHGGLSACVMWPGCEEPYANKRATYNVPYKESYSLTELINVSVSFLTDKFTVNQYRKYVLNHDCFFYFGHLSRYSCDASSSSEFLKNITVHERRKGKSAVDNSDQEYWVKHYMVPHLRYPYSSEREENYVYKPKKYSTNSQTETTDIPVNESEILDLIEEELNEGIRNLRSENRGDMPPRLVYGEEEIPVRNIFYDRAVNVTYYLESGKKANLVMARYKEPAATARRYGNDSSQMKDVLLEIDGAIGHLKRELQRRNLLDRVDLVVVSDHATVPLQHIIDLSPSPALYNITGESPLLHVWPKPGFEDDVLKLLSEETDSAYFTVYNKTELPEGRHYRNNTRVAPILAEADAGAAFSDRAGEHSVPGPWHSSSSQGLPLLLLSGPSFRRGSAGQAYAGPNMSTVDVYPLVGWLLGLPLPPVNGTLRLDFIKPDGAEDNSLWFIFPLLATTLIMSLCAAIVYTCLRGCKMERRPPPIPIPRNTIYRATVETSFNRSNSNISRKTIVESRSPMTYTSCPKSVLKNTSIRLNSYRPLDMLSDESTADDCGKRVKRSNCEERSSLISHGETTESHDAASTSETCL